jgi:hypothetical protein
MGQGAIRRPGPTHLDYREVLDKQIDAVIIAYLITGVPMAVEALKRAKTCFGEAGDAHD